MDAFDADVLIYAATPEHPLGHRLLTLFNQTDPDQPVGVGSVFLLTELLPKPLRLAAARETVALASLLRRLDLRPFDRAAADLSVALAVTHGLRAVDACHLATAVVAGADRFVTNNRRDFAGSITEIAVTYPDDLPTD